MSPGSSGSPGRPRPFRCRVVALASIAAACVMVAVVTGCADSTAPRSWEAVESSIATSFPEVPRITTAELAAMLHDPAREVTLLDVREADEYAVSHLLGAARVASVQEAAALVVAAPWHTTIIAYCSVGYRSAALVAELRERSTRPIYNLKGSLFRWANEDRPVYRGSEQVDVVHPFTESWGALLDSHRHAYEPVP